MGENQGRMGDGWTDKEYRWDAGEVWRVGAAHRAGAPRTGEFRICGLSMPRRTKLYVGEDSDAGMAGVENTYPHQQHGWPRIHHRSKPIHPRFIATSTPGSSKSNQLKPVTDTTKLHPNQSKPSKSTKLTSSGLGSSPIPQHFVS